MFTFEYVLLSHTTGLQVITHQHKYYEQRRTVEQKNCEKRLPLE